MTIFQFVAVAGFAAAVLVSNYDAVAKWLNARDASKPLPPDNKNKPQPNRPAIVAALETVVDLRQKFIDAGCDEGVEACNVLLRVLIDHPHPHWS